MKYPGTANQTSYPEQRKFCVSLLRQEKKKIFCQSMKNVNVKNIAESNKF